jgi:Ca2+-binding RTX toxin-like protein
MTSILTFPDQDFQISSTFAGNQENPNVVLLTSGGMLITWDTVDGNGAITGTSGQFFDKDRNPVGSEFDLNGIGVQSDLVSWCETSDGDLVAAWIEEGGYRAPDTIMGQRFTSTGSAVGSNFEIGSGATESLERLSLTAMKDGRYVATWGEFGSSVNDVFSQIMADDDTPDGTAFSASATSEVFTKTYGTAPTVGLADGGFVVFWHSGPSAIRESQIASQQYDAAGNPVGEVNLVDFNYYSRIHTAETADGGYVLSFAINGSQRSETFYQKFDSSGELQASGIANTFRTGFQSPGLILPTEDGGFWIIWSSRKKIGSYPKTFGQQYDSEGNPVGVETSFDRIDDIFTVWGGRQFVNITTGPDGDGTGIVGNVYGWNSLPEGEFVPEGFAIAGHTLTADISSLADADGINQSSVRLFWLRDGNIIVSATQPTYELTAADAGAEISYLVTYTDGLGVEEQVFSETTVRVALNGQVRVGTTGDDTITGDAGQDYIYGDAGNDILEGGADTDRIFGGSGNDIIRGDEGDDTLRGEGNADQISGGDGRDTIYGGAGRDKLYGNADRDWIEGGNGNDFLSGGNGGDVLYGQGGDDIIRGNGLKDLAFGGDGDDQIYGGTGDDELRGEAGRDTIEGGSGDDALFGGAGKDKLAGDDGADELDGGNGSDLLNGGAGNDTLLGQEGDDVLNGGYGEDTLKGGMGDDTLRGGGGSYADKLFGEAGDDTLRGEQGADELNGGDGNDNLNGGAGIDSLLGGDGNDQLLGGAGNDTLNGGDDNDILTGSGGHDLFVFSDGHDTITDFDALANAEKIDLSGQSAIADFNSMILDGHIQQVGANVVISDFLGNTLTLNSVNLSDLDGSDFIF